MRRKLYSNMKRMTTIFCLAIVCLTLTTLTLRLTVLGDLTGIGSSPGPEEMDSGLSYVIARRVNFSSPEAPGDFRIENPGTNEHLMRVSIIDDGTGYEVFYTGLIIPGEGRGAYALHRQLPPGVHDGTARITAYDPVTLRRLGSHEQEITLHIG